MVDVLISGSASAFTEYAQLNAFDVLPGDVADMVSEHYRAVDDTWVAIAGRLAVLRYHPDHTTGAELPESILDLTGPPPVFCDA